MAITFRADKGSALTYSELDTNFGSFIVSGSSENNTLTLHYATSSNVPVSQSAISIPLIAAPAAGGSTGSIQYHSASVVTGNEEFVYDADSGAMGIGYSLTEVQALQNQAATANHKLIVSGSIETSGNVIAFSDERLKSNLEEITSSFDILENITGYTFDKDNQRSAGVIAQHVQNSFPVAVQEGMNGYLGVDYNGLVAVLIQAVKQLNERVKELENK